MDHFALSLQARLCSSVVAAFLLLGGCSSEEAKTITIKNPLGINREAETISIPVSDLKALESKYGIENILVRPAEQEEYLVTQLVDNDQDGKMDELLFQVDMEANEEKDFVVKGEIGGAALQPKSEAVAYSRFVPERTDDYTWENDKVAFRTYGPEAQRLVEEGEPGGTLSSGIDLWLKRVEYSIIDDWYKKNLESPGYYHVDHGEGYDPYHVGISRGTGGTGVWVNDTLWVSKNFVEYKTIAAGPIRTVFELTYAPWQAGDAEVTETKRISLDLGSNLTHFQVEVKTEGDVSDYATGITLHDKKGEVFTDKNAGWFAYWEPMDGSELGTAIVMNPEKVTDFTDHRVEAADKSHLLVLTDPAGGKVEFYAGFGWKKSGQFNSPDEWTEYLADFSKRLATPLEVNFK